MEKSFLGIALAAHELWLRDDKRGNRFSVPYGSDLCGCDLSDSNLRDSNLRDCDLRGCDLRGCDLSDSNLSGCNLRGCDLSGCDLSGCDRIIGPLRSDGYLFTFCTESGLVIAGCQRKSIAEYIEHCNTYEDPAKGRETLAILECLKLLVAAREAQP